MPLPNRFEFQSAALAAENLQVIRFTGEEGVSRPYRFEIEIESDNPAINLASVLSQPASLVLNNVLKQALNQGDGKRNIHGVVAEMELTRELPGQRYVYRVVLVPRLWLLTLNQQNKVYQNQRIPAIIAEVLLHAGHNASTSFDGNNIFADYIEFRLHDYSVPNSATNSAANSVSNNVTNNESATYPECEYIVQYHETDLNFIARLMEHEGISYFFEQGEYGEKLIIGDHNQHFCHKSGLASVAYQSATNASNASTATENDALPEQKTVPGQRIVQQLRRKMQQLPQQVLLKDYNYRNATLPCEGRQTIVDEGIGVVAQYGTHFKTPEQGQHYANIRAEEVKCQQHTFSAESRHHYFHGGECFELMGHYVTDFNRNYLITHVAHTGVADGHGSADECGYHNVIHCQPDTITYRPPRVTAKPRLFGIMNATIDGSDSRYNSDNNDEPTIDEQGRYKVTMPFDVSGVADGQASRYLRLATPFSGSNQGMHFPLRKGTEVIWTCVDGDLDRPIIVGAVPNSTNKSVVTSKNNSANVIRTASGIHMEFNDGTRPGYRDHGLPQNTTDSVDTTVRPDTSRVTAGLALQQQQHYSSAAITITSQGDVEEGRPMTFTVTLPHRPPAGHSATLKFTASGNGVQSSIVPDVVIDANSALNQVVSVSTIVDINLDKAVVVISLNTIMYSSGYPASQHYVAQATATGNVLDKEVNLSNESGTIFYRVDVPYTSTDSAYLRIGASPVTIDNTANPPTCSPGSDAECDVWNYHRDTFLNISDAKMLWLLPTPGDVNFNIDWPTCKWLEHTDGTRVAITGGDYNIFANGSVATTSLGTSITYTLNDSYEVVMTSKYDVTSQFTSSIGIGGAVSAFLGAQVELNAGTKFDVSPQKRVSVLGGGEVSYTRKLETNAVKSIKFQVENTNTKAVAIGGAIAATLGAATGVVAAELGTDPNDPEQKDKLTRAIRDVSTAVWGAGTAAVATLSVMSLIKKLKPTPESTFEMYKDQLFLQCGDSALLMKSDGTVILDAKKIILNGTDKVEINSKDAVVSASDTTLKAKSFKLDAATEMSGNLDITKGSLEVPKGTIKGAGGKIGEQVFLSAPAAPVVSDADVQLAQQFGSVNQILNVAMLRRRQALMGDEA